MFTGIITGLGTVRDIRPLGGGRDMRLVIATPWSNTAEIPPGASIACSGCCLTAVELGADWFAVEVSAETLSKTTLGGWAVGSRVNLERPLKVGDELGGHIVSGHVDGVAKIVSITQDGPSRRILFEAPEHLSRYIAPKGSVALDGTSLTVNEVAETHFGVNLIPHSLTVTTWGAKNPGDLVNLEVDVFARYVARLMEFRI